jgi:hypothetical protein
MGRARNKLIAIRGLDSVVPGPPGSAGPPAYVYIAYASALDGTGFTMTNNPSLDYMAIKSTNTELPNPVVSDFAGLWFKRNGASVDILQVQVFS